MAKQRAKTQGHTNKWQKAHVQVTVERFSVSMAIKKIDKRKHTRQNQVVLVAPEIEPAKFTSVQSNYNPRGTQWVFSQLANHPSLISNTSHSATWLTKTMGTYLKSTQYWRQPASNLFVNDDLAQLPEWAKNLILPNNKHCTVFLSVMGLTRDLL